METTTYFPFTLMNNDGNGYTIAAFLEGDELYPKYYEFFKKHGYEGNGYCWEGHITQILEKLDEELLSQIDFDPEAGSFFANTGSEEAQLKFVTLLAPVFSDLNKLEEWVLQADRDRVDD